MTVYVDDMRARIGRMVLSHMIADTDKELHAMAARIGVSRRWHQRPPKVSTSHYDITQGRRLLAIEAGAVQVTMRTCAAMAARRRVTGELGDPADALDWYRGRRDVIELPLADDEVRCKYCRLPHRADLSLRTARRYGGQYVYSQVCPACMWREGRP